MAPGFVFFFVVCAGFVVGGFVVLLNIFGAADYMAAQNRRRRDDPMPEPGHRPQTRGGMRLWGLAAVVSGVVPIVLNLSELA